MKKLLFSTALILSALSPQFAHAYFDDLDGLLGDHTKQVSRENITYNGVDYDAWAKDPRHATVRDEILSTNVNNLKSQDAKLAYWINAYNVLTIDLINSKNERDSIKNIGTVFTSAWKSHKWTFADGRELHLDNIEHDIVRKFGDARIHFAVNCAAKSCPDLRDEAYRPNKLNAQLNEQTRLTLKNGTKGFEAVEGANIIRVSKVMDWFKEDFDDGNLNTWLEPYLGDRVNDSTKIKFFNYDWSLNKQ